MVADKLVCLKSEWTLFKPTEPGMYIYLIIERVALACVRDKVGNGATYAGEILHADSCGAWEVHGLGLMSIGATVGKKIVL